MKHNNLQVLTITLGTMLAVASGTLYPFKQDWPGYLKAIVNNSPYLVTISAPGNDAGTVIFKNGESHKNWHERCNVDTIATIDYKIRQDNPLIIDVFNVPKDNFISSKFSANTVFKDDDSRLPASSLLYSCSIKDIGSCDVYPNCFQLQQETKCPSCKPIETTIYKWGQRKNDDLGLGTYTDYYTVTINSDGTVTFNAINYFDAADDYKRRWVD